MIIHMDGKCLIQAARMMPVSTDQWGLTVEVMFAKDDPVFRIHMSWEEVRTLTEEYVNQKAG